MGEPAKPRHGLARVARHAGHARLEQLGLGALGRQGRLGARRTSRTSSPRLGAWRRGTGRPVACLGRGEAHGARDHGIGSIARVLGRELRRVLRRMLGRRLVRVRVRVGVGVGVRVGVRVRVRVRVGVRVRVRVRLTHPNPNPNLGQAASLIRRVEVGVVGGLGLRFSSPSEARPRWPKPSSRPRSRRPLD